jgi:hypothetical protein
MAYWAVNPSATIAEIIAINSNIRLIKYSTGITLASVTGYLSTVDGTAFATGLSVDPRPYVMTPGWKFSIKDSANKVAVAYGKAAGTGETLDTELNPDPGFADAGSWDCDAGGSIAGGKAVFTDAAVGTNIITKTEILSTVLSGIVNAQTKLFKSVYSITDRTDGSVRASWNNAYDGATKSSVDTFTEYVNLNASGVPNYKIKLSARTTGTDLACDNYSVKQVLTPGPTGLTLTDTAGGATFNWASIEAGFDPNSASFTVTITRT